MSRGSNEPGEHRHAPGGNHLEHESNRQRTNEGTDGGLRPAVDGQNLGEIGER